jgi:predicted transcriptional regulator
MKYLKEVDRLLEELFREDWMNDDDWNNFLEEVERTSGITIERLSSDIEIGVNNGYSFDTQIQMLKENLMYN